MIACSAAARGAPTGARPAPPRRGLGPVVPVVPGNSDLTDQDFALLVYNGTSATPLLLRSPGSLGFRRTVGAAEPAAQALRVSSSGAALGVSATASAPWLSVTPSGATPADLMVAVNGVGLAAGSYAGAVTLSAAGAANSPLTVPVTFTIDKIQLGLAPTSLACNGTEAAAAPADQTIGVTSDSPSGDLSVTSGAPWLSGTLSATTTPATLTVHVDTAGLALGTYSATLALASSSPDVAPATVPVTLTVGPNCGSGASLSVNGDLEGSAAPWVLGGQAGYTNTGLYPFNGAGYVFLGQVVSTTGTFYQEVALPQDAADVALCFVPNVSTAESGTITPFDILDVEARDSAGGLLTDLASFSNLHKNPAGVYVWRGPLRLTGYQGQTVRLQFRAVNDSSFTTTFRLDGLQLKRWP